MLLELIYRAINNVLVIWEGKKVLSDEQNNLYNLLSKARDGVANVIDTK